MTGLDEPYESPANILCRSCGLCCTGHLFIWAKLRPAELDPAEALGMTVYRSDPGGRGFSQPCPLWQDQCTIYESPHYPHVCRAYKCKLLRVVLGEWTSLPDSMTVVEQAKGMIHEVEALLPISTENNFRQRLVAHLEHLEQSAARENPDLEFGLKAGALLFFYEKVFGVTDLVEKPDD